MKLQSLVTRHSLLVTVVAALAAMAASAATTYGSAADVVNSASGLAFCGETTLLATTGSSATPKNGEKERALIAYSIATPVRPVEVGRLALEDAPFPQGIAVAGDRAFVVDGLNLWCVEVKDVAKMSVISKTAISDAGETGPRAVVLDPDGKTAYLACGRAGVRAYDVSTPAEPRLLWDCPTSFSRDVALFADGVASAEELAGVAFVRDGKLVDKLKLPRDGAVSLRALGDRLYVANGSCLLSVLVLTPEGKLKVLCGHEAAPRPSFGTYSYFALPVKGGTVYVLDGESGLFELRYVWRGAHTFEIKRSSGSLKYPVTKAAVERDGWLYVSCSGLDGPSRLLAFDLMASDLRPVAEAE
jgi:hypothetical protein